MDLSGKVVIVTGAGKGIGRETARLMASMGAKVVLVARSSGSLLELEQEIRNLGFEALAVPADVSQEAEVRAMVERTLQAYGTVDVLVNNAAISAGIPVISTPVEEWDRILEVNLRGTFLCCREVLPIMLERNCGSIVNVSSSAARHPFPGYGAYSASKAGIVALTMVLAEEIKGSRVRVNAILPGLVATETMRARLGSEDLEGAMEPIDVARVIAFLASDDAWAIHGAAIEAYGRKL
jgi:NAD(P)-dependent dehydrogenase (short-subunit alcohol dehydrogenase family)